MKNDNFPYRFIILVIIFIIIWYVYLSFEKDKKYQNESEKNPPIIFKTLVI